ncbi:MAG: hypothetical protein V4463_13980 [Pseudomonadota bacterium]
MKAKLYAVLLAIAACGSGKATEVEWEWRHRAFSGVYGIYGGDLGDPVPPKQRDKKIMFNLRGAAAKDLFDAIGPDVKDECTAADKIRVRKRDGDNLVCMRTNKAEYSCSFGFDLTTGKSIGGSIC